MIEQCNATHKMFGFKKSSHNKITINTKFCTPCTKGKLQIDFPDNEKSFSSSN